MGYHFVTVETYKEWVNFNSTNVVILMERLVTFAVNLFVSQIYFASVGQLKSLRTPPWKMHTGIKNMATCHCKKSFVANQAWHVTVIYRVHEVSTYVCTSSDRLQPPSDPKRSHHLWISQKCGSHFLCHHPSVMNVWDIQLKN